MADLAVRRVDFGYFIRPAEETGTGLPAETVAELPGILRTLTGNVDTRRPRNPHGAGPES